MRISDWSSDLCPSDLAAEQAQCVDAVERLRPARHLHHRERAALRWAHAADLERQVIDLRLHDCADLAVAFGAAPHHPPGPETLSTQPCSCRLLAARNPTLRRQPPGIQRGRLGGRKLE